MATLVCFHAHPDDESIATGGLMALAAEQGHRVVLVLATRGERGEPVLGVLDADEMLWERRIVETYTAAEILGVRRVEFLGYVDSGMMGEDSNAFPYSFWTADVESAARRLATILEEEDAAVLTTYDEHGGYGHPDHIQVHRVGQRAAELAGTPQVLQSTMNRDRVRAQIAEALTAPQTSAPETSAPDSSAPETSAPGTDAAAVLAEFDAGVFGSPEAVITHAIDVAGVLEIKRAAMSAHRSQISEDSWFLTLDDEQFATAFGTEWYIDAAGSRGADEPFITWPLL